MTDSGFLEFSDTPDPLILVNEDGEEPKRKGEMKVEVDTNLSSSSIGTSLSSDGFQTDSTISSTSTPSKSVSKRSVDINSEDGEDLRIKLVRGVRFFVLIGLCLLDIYDC